MKRFIPLLVTAFALAAIATGAASANSGHKSHHHHYRNNGGSQCQNGSYSLGISADPSTLAAGESTTISGDLLHCVNGYWQGVGPDAPVYLIQYTDPDCTVGPSGLNETGYVLTDGNGHYSLQTGASDGTATYVQATYVYGQGEESGYVQSACLAINAAPVAFVPERKYFEACAASNVLRVGDDSLGSYADLDLGWLAVGSYDGVPITAAYYYQGYGFSCDVLPGYHSAGYKVAGPDINQPGQLGYVGNDDENVYPYELKS